MTCLILSDRQRRLRLSLEAAFAVGYLAGRTGAPRDQTKLDCVGQLAPALEMELFHAIAHHADPSALLSDEPEQRLWEAANDGGRLIVSAEPECAVCPLSWVAHDMGNAGHEFVESPRRPAMAAT